MAFTGIIRKVSPSVVPLALRAIGSSSTTLNHTISASRPRDLPFCSFSSVATAKDSVNAYVYKILKNRIKFANFNLKNCQVNNLPDSFPFKIDDSGYKRELVLTSKMVDDEVVTVKIKMSDVNTKEVETDDTSDNESDGSKKEINEKDVKAAEAIPMTVRVAKEDGDCYLDFKITVSTEDIIIQSFSVTLKDDYDTKDLEGPEFKDLDYEFQQALYMYLEVRGIKSNLASFVLKIMAKEKKKFDLKALKCFKDAMKIFASDHE